MIKNRAKGDEMVIDSLICRVLPKRKKTCFFDASPVAPKIRKNGPKSNPKAPRAPRHFAGGASRWGWCPYTGPARVKKRKGGAERKKKQERKKGSWNMKAKRI